MVMIYSVFDQFTTFTFTFVDTVTKNNRNKAEACSINYAKKIGDYSPKPDLN